MSDLPEMESDDFTRRFSIRAKNVMWLLGAGASATSNIPTASDMIWEFKQRLYVSQRRATAQSVSDLSNPAIRSLLQGHISSIGNMPPPGDAEEYAALFEAVYPAESDRRMYVDSKIAGARPSYGHMSLATLMKAGLARLAWTTNFDPLIADACAKVYGATGHLTSVSLDAPELAREALQDERWPIEIKMHGDFRSRRLKNTTDELREQDRRLRKIFVDCCSRFGLVVVGYSGRDTSVMDALEEALSHDHAFPFGIFWLHRGDGAPLPRVESFLKLAVQSKVEAALVRIESFDEAMRDLVRMGSNIDTQALDTFAGERSRWTPAPAPVGGSGWPVVRLNAIPVTEFPAVCRRVVCKIGGYKDVKTAVDDAKVDVLIARVQAGVLAFGADDDMRLAFGSYGITDFSLHTVEKRRLRYDSAERGLLREALSRALARHRGLEVSRRRSADDLVPIDPSASSWKRLKEIVGPLAGTVGGHPDLRWREGVGLRLDWADERPWLLIEPRTIFEGVTDETKALVAEMGRQRNVNRYNRKLNDLIDFWAKTLAGTGEGISTLATGQGVDAVFKLSHVTGFSSRVGA